MTSPSRFEHKEAFVSALRLLINDIHGVAREKGFYDGVNADDIHHQGSRLMLMVTELGEMFEGLRTNAGQDSACSAFTNEEIELADLIIRALDYAGWRNLRIGEAIVAKCRYNELRPHRHGGKKV